MRTETHELELLAQDFDSAAGEIVDKVARVTGMAMNKMKKGAQKRVRGNPHLPHLARSFSYDVTKKRNEVVGEVGADNEKPQGKLDVYIENGTVNSRAIPHWAPEADAEIPVWQQYLDQVAAEAIEHRGA